MHCFPCYRSALKMSLTAQFSEVVQRGYYGGCYLSGLLSTKMRMYELSPLHPQYKNEAKIFQAQQSKTAFGARV